MKLRVNEDYIAHLKKMEGLRLKAYKPKGEKDTGEVLTIGYGHFGAKPGTVITEEEADALLRTDLRRIETQLIFSNLPPLSDSRWTALVDFVYNIGIVKLKRSTLLKLIRNNPDDERIESEFMRWIYSGNKVLLGLKRRCAYRVELWKGIN